MHQYKQHRKKTKQHVRTPQNKRKQNNFYQDCIFSEHQRAIFLPFSMIYSKIIAIWIPQLFLFLLRERREDIWYKRYTWFNLRLNKF